MNFTRKKDKVETGLTVTEDVTVTAPAGWFANYYSGVLVVSN